MDDSINARQNQLLLVCADAELLLPGSPAAAAHVLPDANTVRELIELAVNALPVRKLMPMALWYKPIGWDEAQQLTDAELSRLPNNARVEVKLRTGSPAAFALSAAIRSKRWSEAEALISFQSVRELDQSNWAAVHFAVVYSAPPGLLR